MHLTVKNTNLIRNKINEIIEKKQLKIQYPNIIAVSKTFSQSMILPLLESGHTHFGENRIQETLLKWTDLKIKYQNIKLHFLGKLQSNKAKNAVQIFDYIHSLDNEKLASNLDNHQKNLQKNVKLFIQINLGNEEQKSGIALNQLKDFYNFCTKDLSLNVIGLMCLPPIAADSENYFKILKSESQNLNLKDLSMGMSTDYLKAILYGSTYLRIGTGIFGLRKSTN